MLAAVGAFLLQPAHAASFFCPLASTAVEKMICADVKLSKLDDALGDSYTRALARAADPNALKFVQKAWLRDTRDACAAAACLEAAYEARIGALEKADGKAPWIRPIYREFALDLGAGSELCQGLALGLREHGLIPVSGNVCGVAFPEGDVGFETVPPWRDLNPSENPELVSLCSCKSW